MRTRAIPLCVLLFVLSPLLAQVQSAAAAADYTPGLRIPAVVSRTIRAEKVRPGDEVRFDLVEGILLGQGVVIPSGAHLRGHVLKAEPITASSPSRLSVEVDSAEWRHGEVPLHAFIAAIVIRQFTTDPMDPPCSSDESGPPDLPHEANLDISPQPACDTRWPLDNRVDTFANNAGLRQLMLETNHSDGSTALISTRKNVRLPAGLMIMLHNVPVVVSTHIMREMAGQK